MSNHKRNGLVAGVLALGLTGRALENADEQKKDPESTQVVEAEVLDKTQKTVHEQIDKTIKEKSDPLSKIPTLPKSREEQNKDTYYSEVGYDGKIYLGYPAVHNHPFTERFLEVVTNENGSKALKLGGGILRNLDELGVTFSDTVPLDGGTDIDLVIESAHDLYHYAKDALQTTDVIGSSPEEVEREKKHWIEGMGEEAYKTYLTERYAEAKKAEEALAGLQVNGENSFIPKQ